MMDEVVRALHRIATALESIDAKLATTPAVRKSAVDEFDRVLKSAIRSIEAAKSSYNKGDVMYAVATHEYKRLGFGSPEALLEEWHDR